MRFRFPSRCAWHVVLLALAVSLTSFACRRTPAEAVSLTTIHTLAGFSATNEDDGQALFGEPFGVAVAGDGTVFVSDGERGRVWAIDKRDEMRLLASDLRAPSGLAVAPDDSLIVAETGAHVIRRFKIDGANIQSSIIAGRTGQAGFEDGAAEAALFNAPVGVAVAGDGAIYVADTYNDRIRRIDVRDSGATVRTIAGGASRGLMDSTEGAGVRFDTPCGIVVLADGALLVADTGNNRLRRVEPNGATHTILHRALSLHDAQTPATINTSQGNVGATVTNNAGQEVEAEFSEPVGIAADAFGNVYVTEAGGAQVKRLRLQREANEAGNASSANNMTAQTSSPCVAEIETIVGAATNTNFFDGEIQAATIQRPHGIAVTPQGEVIIADSENHVARFIGNLEQMRGRVLSAAEARALQPRADFFRRQGEPRWCYAPPERPREIAATFGEVRGSVTPDEDGRFHNGIDIPGAYGETVLAIRRDVALRPVAVEGTGGARERLRLAALGYIHLRVGRDKDDRVFDDSRFMIERDDKGRVINVRVRRGTIFGAGERIGTLNNQNHTHLIAGAYGNELNPFAALEFPGINDTVAPVIEADGIRFLAPDNSELAKAMMNKKSSNTVIEVSGEVRVVARVYDRMTGDAERRRLGVYRLGYQILGDDGTPAANFNEPRWTLTFDRLPLAARASGFGANTVYAIGSQAGYAPQTIFDYIVTNTLRDGVTGEDFWRTGELQSGVYRVRVLAEDFFGNQSSREVRVRVR